MSVITFRFNIPQLVAHRTFSLLQFPGVDLRLPPPNRSDFFSAALLVIMDITPTYLMRPRDIRPAANARKLKHVRHQCHPAHRFNSPATFSTGRLAVAKLAFAFRK